MCFFYNCYFVFCLYVAFEMKLSFCVWDSWIKHPFFLSIWLETKLTKLKLHTCKTWVIWCHCTSTTLRYICNHMPKYSSRCAMWDVQLLHTCFLYDHTSILVSHIKITRGLQKKMKSSLINMIFISK